MERGVKRAQTPHCYGDEKAGGSGVKVVAPEFEGTAVFFDAADGGLVKAVGMLGLDLDGNLERDAGQGGQRLDDLGGDLAEIPHGALGIDLG